MPDQYPDHGKDPLEIAVGTFLTLVKITRFHDAQGGKDHGQAEGDKG